MTERDTDRLLPLRPRIFAILLELAEGPRHGYALMRVLHEGAAGERWLLGPATLYRTLKQMLGDGLITSTEGPGDESEGPPRRYYKLSGFGKRVTAAEAERMRALVERAGVLLGS